MIDPGCDCCSYIPIGEYDTKQEAVNAAAGDLNLLVYKESEEETL
jgi:hypothetical protein